MQGQYRPKQARPYLHVAFYIPYFDELQRLNMDFCGFS